MDVSRATMPKCLAETTVYDLPSGDIGPTATFAHFFVDVFAGLLAGGLIIVGSGIHSQTAEDWIIWSFGGGVPFLAWWGRRAAAKRR
jgi:hypothetical protein